jgi:molybdenum cofactor biosynthesis protein B
VSVGAHRAEAPRSIAFAVVTISDTRDAVSDRGGPLLVRTLEEAGHRVTFRAIVKDEAAEIEAVVRDAVQRADVELLITTGGTGIAPRDVTYGVMSRLFESDIPGFGELFRMLSFQEIGSAALLSRACAGIVGGKVVVALPGSPKALELALREILLKEAGHLVAQARGPA